LHSRSVGEDQPDGVLALLKRSTVSGQALVDETADFRFLLRGTGVRSGASSKSGWMPHALLMRRLAAGFHIPWLAGSAGVPSTGSRDLTRRAEHRTLPRSFRISDIEEPQQPLRSRHHPQPTVEPLCKSAVSHSPAARWQGIR